MTDFPTPKPTTKNMSKAKFKTIGLQVLESIHKSNQITNVDVEAFLDQMKTYRDKQDAAIAIVEVAHLLINAVEREADKSCERHTKAGEAADTFKGKPVASYLEAVRWDIEGRKMAVLGAGIEEAWERHAELENAWSDLKEAYDTGLTREQFDKAMEEVA
jgi:hypothetical protein